MRLDDLREQLHDLSARVPPGETALGDVFERTRRTVRRRRVRRCVVSLAVLVAAVGTLAIVLNASGPEPKTHVTVAATTTTTSATSPPIGLTTEQLRAHDGAGVPKGWAPVDAGDARIWVPKDWAVEPLGNCLAGDERAVVLRGPGALRFCPPRRAVPAQTVEIAPSTSSPRGAPTRIVHGYRVFAITGPPSLFDAVYDVPQLGVRISTRGRIGDTVLATLAPSGSKVARAFAAQPVPHGFRLIAENGVTLSIPSRWTVDKPSQWPCSWPSANGTPALLDIRPGIVFPPCPQLPPSAGDATHDGVYSFGTDDAAAPQPGGPAGRSIAVLHHGSSIVSVYAAPSDPNALDAFVRRAGSSTTHALTVGLGRDGRVAGAVLASIRATQ